MGFELSWVSYLAVRRLDPIKFETEEIFEPFVLMFATEETRLATLGAAMEAVEIGKLFTTELVDDTFEDKLFETIVAVFTQLLLAAAVLTTLAKRGKSSWLSSSAIV